MLLALCLAASLAIGTRCIEFLAMIAIILGTRCIEFLAMIAIILLQLSAVFNFLVLSEVAL